MLYLWTTDLVVSCLLGFLQSQCCEASGTPRLPSVRISVELILFSLLPQVTPWLQEPPPLPMGQLMIGWGGRGGGKKGTFPSAHPPSGTGIIRNSSAFSIGWLVSPCIIWIGGYKVSGSSSITVTFPGWVMQITNIVLAIAANLYAECWVSSAGFLGHRTRSGSVGEGRIHQ